MDSRLSHHATVLRVRDLAKSLAFYQDILGFECTFSWEDPPTYAVMKSGGVSIHLALQDDSDKKLGPSILYIFCHDIDAVFADLDEKGVDFVERLNDAEYGMREFLIHDPDEHRIAFGMEVQRTR